MSEAVVKYNFDKKGIRGSGPSVTSLEIKGYQTAINRRSEGDYVHYRNGEKKSMR